MKAVFFFVGLALSCIFFAAIITCSSSPQTKPVEQRCPWPRCHTAELTRKIGDACNKARMRASVTLYKLRPDAPEDVRTGGIAQALELGEWMSFCGQSGQPQLLAAIGTYPVDIQALRDALAQFTRTEAAWKGEE